MKTSYTILKDDPALSEDTLARMLPDARRISPIVKQGPFFLTLVRVGLEKKLLITSEGNQGPPAGFSGEKTGTGDEVCHMCDLNHTNAEAVRSFLPFTKPVTIGSRDSFGFGDRLGIAGAAHLRSLENSTFIPILAQQSIRELDRTNRTADEVMDAATWAVLQEGYTKGFGSDADHLKTFADIDRMVNAGFTMFTIDPSDHVDNRVVEMDHAALKEAMYQLPWEELGDRPESFLDRYAGKQFSLKSGITQNSGITLNPSEKEVLQAAVKYGRVILHTSDMAAWLNGTYPDHDSEIELSVDETPHPTTPVEHLVVASELQRLNVKLVSLAPRFCGDFEKGIDFKGDISEFSREYAIHQAIAAAYGGYKLSIHSGSDKFDVYEAIGSLGIGTVHVKTAGTSYLEALRAVSMTNSDLFREIMKFSLERFETDKKTYHISADPARVPHPDRIPDDTLPGLLDDDNARQVFHVTFGSVLTGQDSNGHLRFRERLMKTLIENESVHEDCLYKHFRKHIKPFEKIAGK